MSPAFAAKRPVVLIVEDDLLIRLQAPQSIPPGWAALLSYRYPARI